MSSNPIAEFVDLLLPAEALEQFKRLLHLAPALEEVSLSEALGRTLARDVTAPTDLPSFPRSAVDGYAVRAADTTGATPIQPVVLTVVGESLMGAVVAARVTPSTAVKIHTGGMIPDGADAVVMVEQTRVVDDSRIEVYRAVVSGDNRIAQGEDVRKGEFLVGRGHVLRPQDIGGLASVGVAPVPVARRPRVAIISGGDEVVPPEQEPGPAQVRDINSYALEALVRDAGGEPVRFGIAADQFDALKSLVQRAIDTCDVVIVSSGSSVGTRDVTRAVVDDYGDPGAIVHGVALRPGKPTLLAIVRGRPFFGLPGNPVSAICTFDLFVRPTIARYLGRVDRAPVSLKATLLRAVPSVRGLEHYVQVRLRGRDGELCAEPVLGKSNLIFTMVRADGFVRIPAEETGVPAGAAVEVRPHALSLSAAEPAPSGSASA